MGVMCICKRLLWGTGKVSDSGCNWRLCLTKQVVGSDGSGCGYRVKGGGMLHVPVLYSEWWPSRKGIFLDILKMSLGHDKVGQRFER